MTSEEFEALLAFDGERRGLEFKGPGSRDDKGFFANVAQAVLALANRRDGGTIVVGVDEVDDGRGHSSLKRTGMTAGDFGTWASDAVRDGLAEYADPSVDVEIGSYLDGAAHFIIITVREFEDVPVLCKRDYQKTCRRGACYVRPRRKPESVELPTQADMRDLLDLATEKRLRAFVGMARRAGLSVASGLSAQAQYDKQLGSVDSPYIAEIRSRGYWDVRIRPESFDQDRIANIHELPRLARETAVRMRGWDFPAIVNEGPRVGDDWIEQRIDWQHHREVWRYYQSGAFVFVGGFPVDWRDRSEIWPIEPGGSWQPGMVIGVEDIVFQCTEVFELGARLALRLPGDDAMLVSITLSNIAERSLVFDDPRRVGFSTPRKAALKSYTAPERPLARSDLIATARELAQQAAVELLGRFGWETGTEWVRPMQEKLLNNRGV